MSEVADVVRKLRDIADLKPGDPMPEWLPINWGPAMSVLCGDAADLIGKLDDRTPFQGK